MSVGVARVATVAAVARPEVAAALDESLEERLAELVEAGRQSWPALVAGDDERAFLAQLGRHLIAGVAPAEQLDRIFAGDLYLAVACASGRAGALEAFEREVLPHLVRQLSGVDAARADEVLQTVRTRLLAPRGASPPRISEYAGRGPLIQWVRMVARRITAELFGAGAAARGAAEELTAVIVSAAPQIDPELDLIRRDCRAAVGAAIRAAYAALGENDRALLRLHHLAGLTVEQLAATYAQPRSTIGRHLVAARDHLLTAIRTELAERHQLSAAEVDSLLGVLRSRLELSLHRLLADSR